jgi:hypothetical protein
MKSTHQYFFLPHTSLTAEKSSNVTPLKLTESASSHGQGMACYTEVRDRQFIEAQVKPVVRLQSEEASLLPLTAGWAESKSSVSRDVS